jgi:hypothetical protein
MSAFTLGGPSERRLSATVIKTAPDPSGTPEKVWLWEARLMAAKPDDPPPGASIAFSHSLDPLQTLTSRAEAGTSTAAVRARGRKREPDAFGGGFVEQREIWFRKILWASYFPIHWKGYVTIFCMVALGLISVSLGSWILSAIGRSDLDDVPYLSIFPIVLLGSIVAERHSDR